ncbi:hypothetical protein KFK09_001751 [Dendrobium nobile]|uniref:CCHC-type domain-containing protein n=1 Tax=Dendrobium nobile TaxID=94219 RepID=A0A8T3C939_DENNO|nr:hypothetical protein KFK09_001751 [Dendrobium nobile]
MDEQTKQWNRCAFARVCVRLDLSKSLPKGVWAQGFNGRFFQPIEYEGIPAICLGCGMVGHKAEVCRVQKPEANVLNPRPHRSDPVNTGSERASLLGRDGADCTVHGPSSSGDGTTNCGDDCGEWTIVTRRRRSRPAKAGEKPNNSAKGQAWLETREPIRIGEWRPRCWIRWMPHPWGRMQEI